MGASHSIDGGPRWLRWNWSRVLDFVRQYEEPDEYDYVLTPMELSKIAHEDLSFEQVSELCNMLDRNKTGIVSAFEVIILLVSQCDSHDVPTDIRFHKIIKLFDFEGNDTITMEAFTVMIICICNAYSVLLVRKNPRPQNVVSLVAKIASNMGIEGATSSSVIPIKDVLNWAKANVLKRSTTTIEYVYDFITTADVSQKLDRGMKSDGAKLTSKGYSNFMELNVLWQAEAMPGSDKNIRPNTADTDDSFPLRESEDSFEEEYETEPAPNETVELKAEQPIVSSEFTDNHIKSPLESKRVSTSPQHSPHRKEPDPQPNGQNNHDVNYTKAHILLTVDIVDTGSAELFENDTLKESDESFLLMSQVSPKRSPVGRRSGQQQQSQGSPQEGYAFSPSSARSSRHRQGLLSPKARGFS